MFTDAPAAPAAALDAPQVELDVRPILQSGGEPFGQIMTAVAAVPEGQVFRLRATFKPVPLFAVMQLRGWSYWVEGGAGDDWTVCFYRKADFAC